MAARLLGFFLGDSNLTIRGHGPTPDFSYLPRSAPEWRLRVRILVWLQVSRLPRHCSCSSSPAVL